MIPINLFINRLNFKPQLWSWSLYFIAMSIYVSALISTVISILIFLYALLIAKSYFLLTEKHGSKLIINIAYTLIVLATVYSFVLIAVYANSTKA